MLCLASPNRRYKFIPCFGPIRSKSEVRFVPTKYSDQVAKSVSVVYGITLHCRSQPIIEFEFEFVLY